MIPLTPDNIDRITDMVFREFNRFSDELSHAQIKEVAPPFVGYKTGTKDIISYLSEVFDKYYTLLSKIENIELVNYGLQQMVYHHSKLRVNFNLISDSKTLGYAIINALTAYFEGLPSKAFDILQNAFLQNNRHLINLIPQIHSTSMYGFRVRMGSNHTEIKDLFHTPFQLRHKCASYRFSILGYPSLYLAESLPTALNEVRAEIDAPYCITHYKYKDAILLVDLALVPHKMTLWERYSLLSFYPLIIACGLKVKNEDSPFRPEYVIPQLFFQIVKVNMPEFAGVSYISTRSETPDFTDMRQRNYVLFVPESSQSDGYSAQLAKKLIASVPMRIKYTNEIDKLIEYEKECALRPKNLLVI